jgi:two-component system, OmpR family, response regulator
MRILLVEDDTALRDTLYQALRLSGYGVDPVAEGQAADAALNCGEYDLVILDLGLPRIDGIEVLKRLRARQDSTPVLILTARDSVDQRVLGFQVGADDYLIKPFALPELEARIAALLRRAGRGLPVLSNGPLQLDAQHHMVLMDGKALDVSVREMTILEALMQRQGQVVTKSRLTQQISDWEGEVGANAVEVYVHRLRKKLQPHGIQIRTIHGLGYLLEQHVDA